MTDTTALKDLLAKVEAGWPPDIDTPYMPPFRAVFTDNYVAKAAWDANNGCFNSALWVDRAAAPNWRWSSAVDADGKRWFVMKHEDGRETGECYAEHDSRALLIATLKALIMEADNA